MIAFGLTQLYFYRWRYNKNVQIDTTMSIGQITPLFLLILPMLATAESYYGMSI
jgi:hypothetical protein